MAGRSLALFLDGTWNDPGSRTNVFRLCELTRAADSSKQLTYYDQGVGVPWYEHLRGGALGFGLSRNVQEAYDWIRRTYVEGDRLYVFGFSRGAYTARSVVGLIARCGLLLRESEISTEVLYARYRRGSKATPLHELEYGARHGTIEPTGEDRQLLEESRRVPVEFIGVWDTVGALGIPAGRIPGLSRKTLYFHNTRLSSIIRCAVHALAIDEHRGPYRPSLWTRFIPHGIEGAGENHQQVEQRWFPGAHSNVGGGYAGNQLAEAPLAWIARRAVDAGLELREMPVPAPDAHLDPVVDSFGRFLGGSFDWFASRHYRVIGWPSEHKDRGTVVTVNETIDSSVFDRWRSDDYRPKNLMDWAGRKGIDPAQIDTVTPA